MARRKKRSTMKRRRSRVGAVPKGSITASLGLIAGAVAGRLVAKKVLPNVDEKIKNVGVIAVGFLLPKFLKSEIGKSIGAGMVAAGGLGLAGGFLPGLAGVDDMIEFPVQVGEINDDFSVIAGDDSVMAGDDDNLSVIAGMDDDYDY